MTHIPARAWLALLGSAVALHFGLILNPGYFSHDEWERLDHIRRHGFLNYILAYGAVQAGPEFGHPVRPIGFLQQGVSALLMEASPALVHSLDVLMHGGVAVALLLGLAWSGAPRGFALLAASCFAASPLATPAIGWVGASFDRWYAFFALIACAAAWRMEESGITFRRAFVLVGAAAGAILSKEAAIMLPAAVALTLATRRSLRPGGRPSWRAGALLVALTALPILAYLAVRAPAIFATLEGRTGVGYYAPGVRWLGSNLFGYWSFPVLPHLTDFPRQSRQGTLAFLGATLLHLALAGFLAWRLGWRFGLLYVAGYLVFLLPVLPLPEPGAHYLYASAVPLAVAFAWALGDSWQRRSWPALGLLALGGALMLLNNGLIQRRIHRAGACQAAFLLELDARLAALRAAGPGGVLAIDFEPGAPDAVARRAIYGRAGYDGREGGAAVRLVLDGRAPEGAARVVMGRDCRLF